MTKTVIYQDPELQALSKHLNDTVDAIKADLDERAKTPANAAPFSIRTGENPLTSRRYSVGRLCVALLNGRNGIPDWQQAKQELGMHEELSKRLLSMGFQPSSGAVLVPLGSSLIPYFETEFRKSVAEQTFITADPDELSQIRKDLTAGSSTSGGTLVDLPTQGQVIEFLRSPSVFFRAGVREEALPPSGSIRFPRWTGEPTTYGVAESGAVTATTPSTGELTLSAKTYSSVVKVSEEWLRFSIGSAGEAMLRSEMAKSAADEVDRDLFVGQGGTRIKGLISYSGATTRTATTVAANGNTLGSNDPSLLIADVANANVDVADGTAFWGIRPQLWSRVTHRRADAVSASDAAGPYLFNAQFIGGVGDQRGVGNYLEGVRVFLSTHVPGARAKGTGTNLTLLFFGVASQIIFGRVGVGEVAISNSAEANDFRSRLNSIRFTQFVDGGPRYEEAVGVIDTLLPTT